MPLTVDQPVATPGSRILLRATKYDGSAHWIQPFTVIADDGQMVITQYRARTPIFTSRGEFRSPYDSRVYFWRDRWYNVFRLSKPRNDLSLWYCNVTTPLTVQPGQLSYVDLDSDEEVSNQRSRVTDRVSGGLSTAARTRVIMGCWSLSRLVSTCLEEL